MRVTPPAQRPPLSSLLAGQRPFLDTLDPADWSEGAVHLMARLLRRSVLQSDAEWSSTLEWAAAEAAEPAELTLRASRVRDLLCIRWRLQPREQAPAGEQVPRSGAHTAEAAVQMEVTPTPPHGFSQQPLPAEAWAVESPAASPAGLCSGAEPELAVADTPAEVNEECTAEERASPPPAGPWAAGQQEALLQLAEYTGEFRPELLTTRYNGDGSPQNDSMRGESRWSPVACSCGIQRCRTLHALYQKETRDARVNSPRPQWLW